MFGIRDACQGRTGSPEAASVSTRMSRRVLRLTVASAYSLGCRHDDPFGSAHVGHPPDVLVLTDPADQAVAVRGDSVEAAWRSSTSSATLRIPSSVDIAFRRSGLVLVVDEVRQLHTGAAVRWPQHGDLAAGVADAVSDR